MMATIFKMILETNKLFRYTSNKIDEGVTGNRLQNRNCLLEEGNDEKYDVNASQF
jgi:hypothetical protein